MEVYAKFIEYVRSQQVIGFYVHTALKEFDKLIFVSDKCMISNFLFLHHANENVKKHIIDNFYCLRHPLQKQIGDHWEWFLGYKSAREPGASKLIDILKDIQTNEKKLIPYFYFVSASLKVVSSREEEFFDLKNVKFEPADSIKS